MNYELYAIEELKHCIKGQDLIKAKAIFNQNSYFSKETTKKFKELLFENKETFSVPIFLYMIVKAPKHASYLESCIIYLLKRNSSCLIDVFNKLTEKQEMLLLVSMVSQIKNIDAEKFYTLILRNYNDNELITASLRAISHISSEKFLSIISDLLYADDLKMVKAAINTIGHCSLDMAVNALMCRSAVDIELDKCIIRSLSKCATRKRAEALGEYLCSPNSTLRNLARLEMSKLKEVATPILKDILKSTKNDDLLIICLNTIAENGDNQAVRAVRKLVQSQPHNPNVRFAAYDALGHLLSKESTLTLTDGLFDNHDMVRVAAAKSLEKNWGDFSRRGIINLLNVNEDKSDIIEAILTAEGTEVFLGLIGDSLFKDLSINFFKESHNKQMLDFYLRICRQHDLSDMVEILFECVEKLQTPTQQEKIIVVDDSRLLLRIYQKILSNTGYSFELFEFAESAFESIKKRKPKLVITDLNMPGMDGKDLVNKIRGIYPNEELPIVMVTTQENEIRESIQVQEYLIKPFNQEMIDKTLNKYLNRPSEN